MKVKYNNGGVGDPPKGIPSKERIRQLESLNRAMTEAERREYASYSFNPAAGPNALFSMLAGFSPAAEAVDVFGKGLAYGAGYLSRLSPAANKVLGYLGAGKKASKADDAYTDYTYSGDYKPDPDDPFAVEYPSEFMPYGRGERAASNLLERRKIQAQRNKDYTRRITQLKELYVDRGEKIPEYLTDLANARRVGDQAAIKRLEKLNQSEIEKAMQRISDDMPADAMERARFKKTDEGKQTSEMLKELMNRRLNDQ